MAASKQAYGISCAYLVVVAINQHWYGGQSFSLSKSDWVDLVIWAPLVEELIYRHILLLPGLIFKRNWLLVVATLLGSWHFGWGHPNPLLPTIFGFWMCCLRIDAKSVLPCIIIHSIHNLIVSI